MSGEKRAAATDETCPPKTSNSSSKTQNTWEYFLGSEVNEFAGVSVRDFQPNF